MNPLILPIFGAISFLAGAAGGETAAPASRTVHRRLRRRVVSRRGAPRGAPPTTMAELHPTKEDAREALASVSEEIERAKAVVAKRARKRRRAAKRAKTTATSSTTKSKKKAPSRKPATKKAPPPPSKMGNTMRSLAALASLKGLKLPGAPAPKKKKPRPTAAEKRRAAALEFWKWNRGVTTWSKAARSKSWGTKNAPSRRVQKAQEAMGEPAWFTGRKWNDGIYGPSTRKRGLELTGLTFPVRK